MRTKSIKLRKIGSICLVFAFLYYLIGIGDYIYARDVDTDFDYPLNIDIRPLIHEIRSGKELSIKPINKYPYSFLTNSSKCSQGKVHLLILVKSAMNNFLQRDAIRRTWGKENTIPGKILQVLFFLGINESPMSTVQKQINLEVAEYDDIVQIDFIDNYYNNTLKTMMSFRWVYQNCPIADYYFFSDDDMYVSIPNLLKYVQNVAYDIDHRPTNDNQFYAGRVYKSRPQRFFFSKWRVSHEEYPWSKWPTYVTAGAYILSKTSLKDMYLGSMFVKHFRFDDIFLGIVAKKVGIKPVNCPDFYFDDKPLKGEYVTAIAAHGYSHYDLLKVWEELHY